MPPNPELGNNTNTGNGASSGAGTSSGGPNFINVHVEVKDIDKIITAISGEALKWYKLLMAQPSPQKRVYALRPNKIAFEHIKIGTRLGIRANMVDDRAEVYHQNMLVGIASFAPTINLHRYTEVVPGVNLIMFWVTNSGAHKYSINLDVQGPDGQQLVNLYDEGNDGDARHLYRLYHYRFIGV